MLDNITLKHIWRFKGPVNVDGKILRELTRSHFGTGHSLHYFACFCAEKRCHHRTSLLRMLSVGGITVKSGLEETRFSEILFWFLFFRGNGACAKDVVQNNYTMLLGRMTKSKIIQPSEIHCLSEVPEELSFSPLRPTKLQIHFLNKCWWIETWKWPLNLNKESQFYIFYHKRMIYKIYCLTSDFRGHLYGS